MAKANPLDGKLKTLAVIIAVVVIAGYIGDWYAENNGGVSCKLGVGGECGAIGSCDEYCDMKEVTLCWAPVLREEIIYEEK